MQLRENVLGESWQVKGDINEASYGNIIPSVVSVLRQN